MKTGIYTDISFDEYLKIDAVSNSYLGRLNKCPANALVETKDTPALLFGRALHCYTLEHMTFPDKYVIALDVDKRTKEGKKTWAEFQALNVDKSIIDSKDMQKIKDIYFAINKHPFAKELLEKGVSEITVIWTDEETGLKCKCRPDRVPEGVKGILIDLKTTTDASEHAFLRSVVGYGYAKQAAMSMEGIAKATGIEYDHFAFIAVEKEPPFRTEVYTLDIDFLGYGFDQFHRLLKLEKQCRDSGIYNNFQNAGASELFLPAYLKGGE